MKHKEYRLVTVADIIDVLTPHNIDNFLIDFKSFVQTTQNLCEICKAIAPELKDKKYSEVVQAVFNWIDDGKHESTGGLLLTDPNTNETMKLPLDIDLVNKLGQDLKNTNGK